jgi:hypothetical protein
MSKRRNNSKKWSDYVARCKDQKAHGKRVRISSKWHNPFVSEQEVGQAFVVKKVSDETTSVTRMEIPPKLQDGILTNATDKNMNTNDCKTNRVASA